MNGWHDSTGILRYTHDSTGHKLIVEVDPGIVAVARALTPVGLNHQKYAPHISVIRHEVPIDLTLWGLNDGLPINFEYNPFVHDDGKYYWVNAMSAELELLRLGLGLPRTSVQSRPPDSRPVFHITIGNLKGMTNKASTRPAPAPNHQFRSHPIYVNGCVICGATESAHK